MSATESKPRLSLPPDFNDWKFSHAFEDYAQLGGYNVSEVLYNKTTWDVGNGELHKVNKPVIVARVGWMANPSNCKYLFRLPGQEHGGYFLQSYGQVRPKPEGGNYVDTQVDLFKMPEDLPVESLIAAAKFAQSKIRYSSKGTGYLTGIVTVTQEGEDRFLSEFLATLPKAS